MKLTLARVQFLAAWLAVWELSAMFLIDPFWISKPTLIGQRLLELALSGDLFWHAWITIVEMLLGLLLGLLIGVPVGLALGMYRNVADIVDPFVLGLYSLPRVALAPLFIIWFGIDLFSKVMLAFSLVVFVFILNVQEGLRNVDVDLVRMMKSMRASRAYMTRKILLPATVPWIFASLRISIGLALIGAVIAELIGASRGLGWYIDHSAGAFDTSGVFAGLVALVMIAMAANALVSGLERRALSWRVTDAVAIA